MLFTAKFELGNKQTIILLISILKNAELIPISWLDTIWSCISKLTYIELPASQSWAKKVVKNVKIHAIFVI